MASEEKPKYSCCSSCLDNERNTVARHYCVECEIYFCTRCLECHNKIPATRKHQINDVNCPDSTNADNETMSLQSDVLSESAHKLRCTLHKDKVIDTYCKDHDEVCCGACAVVKHRLCRTVPTAIAAKDSKTSPEWNECNTAITETTVKFNEEKEKRVENIDSIGKQKLELIETVDKYEEKIIAKIKELADISRMEIRSKYEESKTALDMDIEALDVLIVTNTEYAKELEQSDFEQPFIYVKTNKTVTKDGEMLLQTITTDYKELEIRFCFDETLDNHILQMKSFGVLEEAGTAKECKATFQRNVNIKQSDHYNGSYVHDVCLMDSSQLLATDDDNTKLKRFNSNLQLTDDVKLSGKPVAVCKINNHEVAVRISSTKVVQFVSVGQSLRLTSSFTLADDGFGMTYDASAGEIFACEESKVSVYSKTGTKLRTYDKDTNGEPMFSQCRQIALSVKHQDIYVTDLDKGLIILERGGSLKMKVSLSGVIKAWPLCLLPGDNCLAGSQTSGVIGQVDKEGKQVGNLINTKDGRSSTYCAVYDREQSKLIVGGSQGVISVYTLSAK